MQVPSTQSFLLLVVIEYLLISVFSVFYYIVCWTAEYATEIMHADQFAREHLVQCHLNEDGNYGTLIGRTRVIENALAS